MKEAFSRPPEYSAASDAGTRGASAAADAAASAVLSARPGSGAGSRASSSRLQQHSPILPLRGSQSGDSLVAPLPSSRRGESDSALGATPAAASALLGGGVVEAAPTLELENEPAAARVGPGPAMSSLWGGTAASPGHPASLSPLRSAPRQLPPVSPQRRPHGARVTPLGAASPPSPLPPLDSSARSGDAGGRSASRLSRAGSAAGVGILEGQSARGRRSGGARSDSGSGDDYALASVSPSPFSRSVAAGPPPAGAAAADAVSSLFGGGWVGSAGSGADRPSLAPLPPLPPLGGSGAGGPAISPLRIGDGASAQSPPGGSAVAATRWPVRKQVLGPLGRGVGGSGSDGGTAAPARAPTPEPSLPPHPLSVEPWESGLGAAAGLPAAIAWAASGRLSSGSDSPRQQQQQPGGSISARSALVVVGPRARGASISDLPDAASGDAAAVAAALPRASAAPRSGAVSARAGAPSGGQRTRPDAAALSGGSSVWGSSRLPRPASLASATLIANRRAEAVARAVDPVPPARAGAAPPFGETWGATPGSDDDLGAASQVRPATSPVTGPARSPVGLARAGGYRPGGVLPLEAGALPPGLGAAARVRQAWE